MNTEENQKPTYTDLADLSSMSESNPTFNGRRVTAWIIDMNSVDHDNSIAEMITNLIAQRLHTSDGNSGYAGFTWHDNNDEPHEVVLDLDAGDYVLPNGRYGIELKTSKNVKRLTWKDHLLIYSKDDEKNYTVIFSTVRVRGNRGNINIGMTEVRAKNPGEAIFQWKRIMPEYSIYEIIYVIEGSVVFDPTDEQSLAAVNEQLKAYVDEHKEEAQQVEEGVRAIIREERTEAKKE